MLTQENANVKDKYYLLDSALQKKTESIEYIFLNGMVIVIETSKSFWPHCALGLLASVLWR